MIRHAVVLAARQWSTRLPGKATVDVCGRPMLSHLLDRFRACRSVTDVIVATTNKDVDDPIFEVCWDEGVACYRADERGYENVLFRFDAALQAYAPDAAMVFRGLGDCPFVEPAQIDHRADIINRRGCDVVWPGFKDDPWPIYGARESPWSRHAWDMCVERSSGSQLEHPGSWIYENLRLVRVRHTEMLADEYYRDYRLELDTEADLRVIRAIYEALWQGPGHVIPMRDAVLWLDEHPEVAAINAEVPLKSLTAPSWRRRGTAWCCPECGAERMEALDVVRQGLVTECQRCGERVKFMEIPAFLAGRRKQ